MSARNNQVVDLSGYATKPITTAEIQDAAVTTAKVAFSTGSTPNSSLRSNAWGGQVVAARKANSPDGYGTYTPGISAQRSNGTDDSGTTRLWYRTNGNVSEARLVFLGFHKDGAHPNNFTVQSAVETSDGTTRITFSGSNSQVVTAGVGNVYFSDPFPVPQGRGAGFWIRCYVSVTTGGVWPTGFVQSYSALGEQNNRGVGASNEVLNTGITNLPITTGERVFGPNFIIGDIPRTTQIIALGDSIMDQNADNGVGQAIPVDMLRSESLPKGIQRVVRYHEPVIHLSYAGESVSSVAATLSTRTPFLGVSDVLLVEYGSNDFNNGRTAAQIKADLSTVYAWAVAAGLKVVAFTITPRSTSTDGFVTVGNQTAHASDAVRTNVNDWLRARTDTNIWRVVDGADGVESARNSGKWKASYTSDGVHPNDTGAAAYWTGIDTARTVSQEEFYARVAGDQAPNTVTSNYTLTIFDAGHTVEMNFGSPQTVTVPPNSSVAFDIGTRITLARVGGQTASIAPGSGVTIRNKVEWAGTTTRTVTPQGAVASLHKRGTDDWILSGDIA